MRSLWIVLLVLSGYAMAEEVYYCTDKTSGANGFASIDSRSTGWPADRFIGASIVNGKYKLSQFEEKSFKIELKEDGNIVISEEGGYQNLHLCSTPYAESKLADGRPLFPERENHKSCVDEDHNGDLFNFNPGNGRYVKTNSSGYVYNFDDVWIQIGTCTKF